MTVSTSTSRSGPYAGAGTTGPFVVTFRFLESSHLRVVQTDSSNVETVLQLSVDYTVAGAGGAGGTVTTIAAVPVGETITVIRAVPATQETDYTQSDPFPAQSHEDALDKLTMLVQQIGSGIDRCLRVPEFTLLPEILTISGRANKMLGFDASGNPSVSTPASGSAAELAPDLANEVNVNKGAGLVGYRGQTVHEHLDRWIWVTTRGVVADGNYALGTGTDNTAAIQAAINALSDAGGGSLFFPPGIYLLTAQIIVPSGVTLIGCGKWSTILTCPAAFNNPTGLILVQNRVGGPPGYPTAIRGFGIVAQTGGAGPSAKGIFVDKNGVFLSDLWVSGFVGSSGIHLYSTDDFLEDFVTEYCAFGVYCGSQHQNISNGTTYLCDYGVVVQNGIPPFAVEAEWGSVVISDVRASNCRYEGFFLDTSRRIQINNCSAGHTDTSRNTDGGLIAQNCLDIKVTNFRSLASINGGQSAAGYGMRFFQCVDVQVSTFNCNYWNIGLAFDNCTNASATNGTVGNNRLYGVLMLAGDRIAISRITAATNGTGAVTDIGILSNNTSGFGTHTISDITCTQASGGVQDYGLYLKLADNGGSTGKTVVTGATCEYNSIGQIFFDTSGGFRVDRIFTSGCFPNTRPPQTVASAATVTIPDSAKDGNTVIVTGGVNITSITASDGASVRLLFAGSATVTDGSNLKLNGSFGATPDDVLSLVGVGANWHEVARSQN